LNKEGTNISKTAIVTSFHSYSTKLVEWNPQAVITFDSHIDSHFLFEGEASKLIDSLPFEDRSAFIRTCVLSLYSFSIPNASLFLVIPKESFIAGAESDERLLLKKGEDINYEHFVEGLKGFLKTALHTNIFESPPNDIGHLLKKLPKRTTILDIDVDYFEEFQGHCYSRAARLKSNEGSLSKLGCLNDFYRTIERLSPQRIVISELMLEQINPPKEPFASVAKFLRNHNYSITYDGLAESDEIALKAISKHEEYVRREQNNLEVNIDTIKDMKETDKKRAAMIKEFYF
jgi:hypothetical protein